MNTRLLESLQNLRGTNPFAALELPFLFLAFVVAVIGYVLSLLGERNDPVRPLIRVGIAAIFISAIPFWAPLIRDIFYFLPHTLLDSHTSFAAIYANITNAVNQAIAANDLEFSFFDAVGSVILDFVVVMMMRAIAAAGSLISIPLLFVQIGVDQFCVVAMPVAIAGITVPAIRNQCQGYIAFWVSILLWPLFFAVVNIIAATVFTVASNLQTDTGYGLSDLGIISGFVAPFAAGAILVGGMLSVPPLAYSICAHGGAAISGPNVMSIVNPSRFIR